MKKIVAVGVFLLSLSGGYYQASAIPPAYEGEFASEGVRKQYIGDVVEEFTKEFFKAEGWTPVDAKTGRGGIDNLFVKFDKNGNVRDVLIVESKGNNSGLNQTKNKGLQMSKEWILKSLDEKISQLEKELSSEIDPRKIQKLKEQLKVLKQVKALVEKNRYRARLLELKYLGRNFLKVVLKEIPPGIDSETLNEIIGQLKTTMEVIIPLNDKGKVSRLLRKNIKKNNKSL